MCTTKGEISIDNLFSKHLIDCSHHQASPCPKSHLLSIANRFAVRARLFSFIRYSHHQVSPRPKSHLPLPSIANHLLERLGFLDVMFLLQFLGLLLGITASVFAAFPSDLAVFENLPSIPQGWKQGGAVPASTRLRFRIAVKQQNAFEFEQHVIDISTPNHAKYGQHMSRDELKRMLRPSSDASEAILNWLDSEGVSGSDVEDDGDWINFHVAAVEAERILDTRSVNYRGVGQKSRDTLSLVRRWSP